MYSNNDVFRAIGRLMAMYAQDTASTMDADRVIEAAPLLKLWQSGTMTEPVNYAVGDVRADEDQPWKCIQAHTHYGEPGWNPAAVSARSLWSPYHAQSSVNALPYVAPTNATDAYYTGEWMIWTDGTACKALRDAVDRGPDELPDAWECIAHHTNGH